MNGKRGLSTIVTTLIMILLVLVAVGIVWVVVSNILSQSSEEIDLGKFTLNTKIEAVDINESSNKVSVKVKRNPGQGELSGFKFIFSNGKNTEIFERNTNLKEFEEGKFVFNLVNLNVSDLVKVSIAPIFKTESGKEIVSDIMESYETGKSGVGSSDGSGGNEGTPETDTTPPSRSNGQPSGTLSSGTISTTLTLATDEPATCEYSKNPGVSYNSMSSSNTFSTTGSTSHSQLITGLQDGDSYNYYVRCNDTSGNFNTNDYVISFSVSSGTSKCELVYRPFFDNAYTQNKDTYDNMAASGGGPKYYNFQYILMGTISMYEATGDVKYLERALEWEETMVASATVTTGGYKSWSGTWDYSPTDGIPSASSLEYLQGSTELARLVKIIRQDSSLNSTYGSRATPIFNFVHENIVVRQVEFSENWHRTSPTSDKTILLTSILINMHLAGATDIYPGSSYHDYAVELINLYLNHVSAPTSPDNIAGQGAELWDYKIFIDPRCGYSPNNEPPCSLDTSHANRWPYMLLMALDAGQALSGVNNAPTGSTLPQHFYKLGRLFSQVIWDNNTSLPKFNNYIDGANHYFRTNHPWKGNSLYHGWQFVAIADSDSLVAHTAMLDAMIAGQDYPENPSMFYNDNLYGHTALTGNMCFVMAHSPIQP